MLVSVFPLMLNFHNNRHNNKLSELIGSTALCKHSTHRHAETTLLLLHCYLFWLTSIGAFVPN
jgi:hypothetical protein